MDGNDSANSLLEKKATTTKPNWLADARDLFVLFCYFLLTTTSIVFIALVIHTERSRLEPSKILSILQRVIAALTTTVTSAMIMVAGKRYVLFKFARGGISSRQVAVYGSPSIGTLACYLVQHGLELPLLTLLAVWALGLATALTVNDVWAMTPSEGGMGIPFFYGPFDTSVSAGSLLVSASAQLSYVMALVCSGSADIAGVINITGAPMELLYPPILSLMPNTAFSVSTALNGFNISMESIPSIPPAAQNLTCVDSWDDGDGFSTGQLWYEGSDNQTLSIIATLPYSNDTSTPPSISPSLYRFNASPIVLGGTLHATGNATEFALNGTTWSNVMSDDRWAKDIVSLICNATYANIGHCYKGASLIDFAMGLNSGRFDLVPPNSDTPTAAGIYWSTALGMAMGAYSAAQLSESVNSNQSPGSLMSLFMDVTYFNWLSLTFNYGLYVLVANVMVSVMMQVVVVRLRMASRLGGDFIHATRLLLNPLKTPELFNASFDTTVDTLANPYMLVRDDTEFVLLVEKEFSSVETTKHWRR
ncbi:hypothetical protein JVU11DRAFT_3553 [Chiua virens]|nr:hypothetical protein JVU11DRAFT_3553 [Chiua virens]